jgi:hypothetical protein
MATFVPKHCFTKDILDLEVFRYSKLGRLLMEMILILHLFSQQGNLGRKGDKGENAESIPFLLPPNLSTVQGGSSIILFTVCWVPMMHLAVDDGVYMCLILLLRLWVGDGSHTQYLKSVLHKAQLTILFSNVKDESIT